MWRDFFVVCEEEAAWLTLIDPNRPHADTKLQAAKSIVICYHFLFSCVFSRCENRRGEHPVISECLSVAILKLPLCTGWPNKFWTRFQSSVRHTRAKILNLSKNSHFEKLIFDKIHISKRKFSTKFTFSKSHFSQNSHLQNIIFHKIHIFENLIFHKIHIFKITFFTKFTLSKSYF